MVQLTQYQAFIDYIFVTPRMETQLSTLRPFGNAYLLVTLPYSLLESPYTQFAELHHNCSVFALLDLKS